MKILIKSLSELLNEKLTLEERGLFITIVLLKDSDPTLTLAKVKAKVQMNKFKAELVNLQDYGFIEWSGYNQAVKSLEEKLLEPEVVEVVDFMNSLYHQNNQYTSKSHYPNLLARLKEHSVEDIKMVISNRYAVWKDDKVMSVNLRASTIFRPSKFDKYLEEAQRTKKGERFLQVSKNHLKDGDEITLEVSQSFTDSENYSLSIHTLNKQGKSIGIEKVFKSGKDIKRSLKIQENVISFGGWKEFKYEYKTE